MAINKRCCVVYRSSVNQEASVWAVWPASKRVIRIVSPADYFEELHSVADA
jgi:hypothetical protein